MKKLLLCLFVCCPFLIFAQSSSAIEIGASVYMASYEGDLHATNINTAQYNSQISYSLLLRKPFGNNFAARLQVLAGSLKGDDNSFEKPEWRRLRGVSFNSPLYEASLSAELYPFGYTTSGRQYRRLRPFLFVGIGGAYTAPEVDWNDANGNDQINPALSAIDKAADTRKIHFVLPIGGGLRFALNRHWSLQLESAIRPTFSDYIDGFSQAGNPKAQDWYFTVGGGIGYAFGSNRAAKKPQMEMPLAPADADAIADRDNDGIPDERDACPDMPGLRALKGCPDRDKDGIPDLEDACPDAPGAPGAKGCPLVDRDKDGVGDDQDLCPDMPGAVEWKGCPDSDDDGLPDNKDECPGIAGTTALKGCPDSDGDGIADKNDDCPTQAGTAAGKGCPEAPAPAPGVPFKAIYFNSTLYDWQKASLVTLDEVVEILQKDPSLNARIEGHTDNTGEEPANDLLSERRAKKCRDFLVSKGIAANRLNFVGFGADRPAVSNETLKGRQLNRRVEIHFVRS